MGCWKLDSNTLSSISDYDRGILSTTLFLGDKANANQYLDSVYWDGHVEPYDNNMGDGGEMELQSFEGNGILEEEIITDILKEPTNGITTYKMIGADNRTIVKDTTANPYRKVVLLEIEFKDGTKGHGTGVLVSSDTVLTAGHNIYQAEHGFIKGANVYPGFNKNKAPYGYTGVRQTVTTTGWVNYGDTEYDFGVLKLNSPIGNKTGWFGLTSQMSNPITLSGYHGDLNLAM